MVLASALIILSQIEHAICRRIKWGESVKHVYLQKCAIEGDSLVLVTEAGGEVIYLPSLDDLGANDWVTG